MRAIDALRGMTEIGGFQIENSSLKVRESHPIVMDLGENIIAFRIQHGPIEAASVNGCQISTILRATLLILDALNEEESDLDTDLDHATSFARQAIEYVECFEKKREARGVEGRSEA